MTRLLRKTIVFILVALLILEALPYLAVTALAAAHPEISAYPLHLAELSQTRPVVGQPSRYSRRVIFIGNSAAWGFGVDDRYTIASRLQAYLPDSLVVNLSSSATFTMAGELLVLQDTPLHEGDVVISYDGDAEFRLAYPTIPICKTNVGIVTLLCHLYGSRSYDSAEQARGIASVKRSLGLMRSYAASHGAKFIHIWQPVIWTAPRSAEEQRMLGVYQANMVIDDVDFVSALPQYIRADPESLDYTNLLNEPRREGRLMFLDSIHTTAEGDAIIAQAIATAVNARLPTWTM